MLGSSSKEKKSTWSESCKESAKRETKLYKMVEIAANDERQVDNERNIIKKTLKQRCDEEYAADEARALLHDMQQNVDEAEATVTGTRRRLYREIHEYMYSSEQEIGATALHHGQSVADDAKQRHQDGQRLRTTQRIRRNKRGGMDRQKQQGSGQKRKKMTTRNREELRSEPARR